MDALRNEADVEQNFVRRLIENIGYEDHDVIPKERLELLSVKGLRGLKQAKYRPDFALTVSGKVRFLIEAKSPSENLDDHVWQPRGYAIVLNGTDAGKQVYRYVLTNGLETRIYSPMQNEPIISFSLAEANTNSDLIETIRALIGPDFNLTNEKENQTHIKLAIIYLANTARLWHRISIRSSTLCLFYPAPISTTKKRLSSMWKASSGPMAKPALTVVGLTV
jgi:type I restriction enzyme M protein